MSQQRADISHWKTLMLRGLKEPRAAIDAIIAQQLPFRLTMLVGVFSVLVVTIALQILLRGHGSPITVNMGLEIPSPFLAFTINATRFVATVYIAYHLARLFGGAATQEAVASVVVWVNVMMMVGVCGAVFLMILFPFGGAFIMLATSLAGVWYYGVMLAHVEGFKSPVAVIFVSGIVFMIVSSLIVQILLALLVR